MEGSYKYGNEILSSTKGEEFIEHLYDYWTLFLLSYKAQKLALLTKLTKTKTKLRGLSPQMKYTDGATAACRRS
jgi:hypothetical protein